jgi:hypothetical protein
MTNPQKVYDFLKKNPRQMFCDDCLEKKTGVDRHEVNTVASTLALFPKEFSRVSTTCVQRCSNSYKMATEAL